MSLNKSEILKIKTLTTGNKKFEEKVELICVFSSKSNKEIIVDFPAYAKRKKYLLVSNIGDVKSLFSTGNVLSMIEENILEIINPGSLPTEGIKKKSKNRIILVDNIKEYNTMLQNKSLSKILKTKPIIIKDITKLESIITEQNALMSLKTSNKKSIALKIADNIESINHELISGFEEELKKSINTSTDKKAKKIRIIKMYLKTSMGKPISIR